MTEVKDKVVTVESLSALHEYNKDTYIPMVDPSGSGTMTFDGDIKAESLELSGNLEIYGNQKVNADSEICGNQRVDCDSEIYGNQKVNGNIEVVGDVVGDINASNNIIIKNINNGLYCIHPDTDEPSSMVHMNPNGNTVIGYDGYVNRNGNSLLYGEDVEHYIASAGNVYYRPYYRAGDVISFNVRTSGYVTNMGADVYFTIPITKPVIGNPSAMAESEKGFILRQRGAYTHGCKGDVTPAIYAKPISYSVDSNYNGGFVITASFEDLTGSFNNDTIGIYWDGKITLYYPEQT